MKGTLFSQTLLTTDLEKKSKEEHTTGGGQKAILPPEGNLLV